MGYQCLCQPHTLPGIPNFPGNTQICDSFQWPPCTEQTSLPRGPSVPGRGMTSVKSAPTSLMQSISSDESPAQSGRIPECLALSVGGGPQQILCLKTEGGKPGEYPGEPCASLRSCPGPGTVMPLHASLRSQTLGDPRTRWRPSVWCCSKIHPFVSRVHWALTAEGAPGSPGGEGWFTQSHRST